MRLGQIFQASPTRHPELSNELKMFLSGILRCEPYRTAQYVNHSYSERFASLVRWCGGGRNLTAWVEPRLQVHKNKVKDIL